MRTAIILSRFVFQLLTVTRPWTRLSNVIILERSEGSLYLLLLLFRIYVVHRASEAVHDTSFLPFPVRFVHPLRHNLDGICSASHGDYDRKRDVLNPTPQLLLFSDFGIKRLNIPEIQCSAPLRAAIDTTTYAWRLSFTPSNHL